MADNKKKVSLLRRVANYFREVKSDVKKISWPSPRQTAKNTGIVIVSLLFAGTLISLIDFIFAQIVAFIISR